MQSDILDENLYSRQLYVYGHDTMKSMTETSILICGMGGLGVEIVKNVILSGIQNVTIQDTVNTIENDLYTQYYLTKKDIGHNRAERCYDKLCELNAYVTVKLYTKMISKKFVSLFDVVIMTDTYDIDNLCWINDYTHKHNIKFIMCSTRGYMGQVFCDFGENFVVNDVNGERLNTAIIEHVSNEEHALVTCTKPHNMTTDDVIEITNSGMKELDGNTYKIKYKDKCSFHIKCDTQSYAPYDTSSNGDITQVKVPKTINFKPLKTSMDQPECLTINYSDMMRPYLLHAIWRGQYDMETHEDNVRTSSIDRYLEYVKNHIQDPNDDIVRKYVYTKDIDIVPLQGIIGGIVSQEIIKACSGKFHPIVQWLYFDAYECLQEDYENHTIDLADIKCFIVGSGAIGCELLKNFAMSGVGHICVTDMDTIEKSNLNRQFLFRSNDIGKPKSVAARDSVLKLSSSVNPKLTIDARLDRVGTETEHVFNEKFFSNIDVVVNALDNIDARLYMDARCVLHQKPLLESGTLGTKGNVQVVIPHKTLSYGSTEDPPEESIPVCTIKQFPHNITHTCEWAKEYFEETFCNGPITVRDYINNPIKVHNMHVGDAIKTIKKVNEIIQNIPTSIIDCIQIAYASWHTLFRDEINNILTEYPPDHITDTGGSFWCGEKKCPQSLVFDIDDDNHIGYILSHTIILMYTYNINKPLDLVHIKSIVSKLIPPAYISQKIKIYKENNEDVQNDYMDTLDDMLKTLPDISKFKNIIINPIKFEKDDDTNHHIDFMTYCANIRAINYGIPTASRHQIKGIVGKIVPALITTTSIISALVTLELYKLVNNLDLDRYHDTFLNLALPYIGHSEPQKVSEVEYMGASFTMWDNYTIKGDITLATFLKYFEDEYGYDIDTVMYNESVVYMFYASPDKMQKTVKTILEDLLEIKFNTDMITLTISVEDDVDLPSVKYYF